MSETKVEVDKPNELMIIQCSDWLSIQDVECALYVIVNHPEFDPAYNRLIDLRGAAVNLDMKEMKLLFTSNLGRQFNAATNPYKTSYLVCDKTEQAVLDLFQSIRTKSFEHYKPSQVFLEKEKAIEWLFFED